jgi:hypothetical protein
MRGRRAATCAAADPLDGYGVRPSAQGRGRCGCGRRLWRAPSWPACPLGAARTPPLKAPPAQRGDAPTGKAPPAQRGDAPTGRSARPSGVRALPSRVGPRPLLARPLLPSTAEAPPWPVRPGAVETPALQAPPEPAWSGPHREVRAAIGDADAARPGGGASPPGAERRLPSAAECVAWATAGWRGVPHLPPLPPPPASARRGAHREVRAAVGDAGAARARGDTSSAGTPRLLPSPAEVAVWPAVGRRGVPSCPRCRRRQAEEVRAGDGAARLGRRGRWGRARAASVSAQRRRRRRAGSCCRGGSA